MIKISGTDEWSTTYPGAVIGVLELKELGSTLASLKLNQHKRETEARLRKDYAGFNRQDFLALPVMAAYEKYYKRFDKTYHVQLQVESIVFKAKNLPDVSPLVDANFAAEVDTFMLTAGHDADKLEEPVLIDVSCSGDAITSMNGNTKSLQIGDMIMRDRQGICCSILYGQDNRSLISASTQHVLYVTYAPPGVLADVVDAHLRHIQQHIRLFAPQARVEQSQLLIA